MKSKYKIIIAHPAQQHSYRTAVALKKSGFLYKYITTVYNKKKSLTYLVTKFLKGDDLKRVNNRNCIELDDEDVIQFCELSSLFLLFLQRVDKKRFIYNIWSNIVAKSFNRKVVKYAIKNDIDAVIMYDTKAYLGFDLLKKKAPNIIRIIDMSAPSFVYMDAIFKSDINKNKKYSALLKKEMESASYKRTLEESKNEIKLANYFLVASTFSEKSLHYHKIPKERIIKIPYGIDKMNHKHLLKENKSYDNRKLKCIFVGKVTQKKGAIYLFKTIKLINLDKFSFKFVGTYDKNSDYYKEYKDICEFEGHVTKDKMVSIYCDTDIMVFPSLADGFGLSVLEALHFGIPVICSENAGASDLIINGFNGFIIPVGNEDEIYYKLQWLDCNREKIREMSLNAKKTALQYTWDKYNKKLGRAINRIREI